MTHLFRHNPHPCQPCQPSLRKRRRARWRFLLSFPVVGLILACASCADTGPPPPPVPVTDTRPVGEGLKVIGFAVLGAAVVAVLGRMIR